MHNSDVKIRTKIIVIITVYAILTLFVGGIGSNQLLFIGNELNRISSQFFPVSITIDSIKNAETEAGFQYTLYYKLESIKDYDPAEKKEIRKRFFEAHKRFEFELQESVEILQDTIDATRVKDEQQDLLQISLQLEHLQLLQQQLLKEQTEVISDLRSKKLTPAELNKKTDQVKSRRQELLNKLESLQESIKTYILSISEDTRKNQQITLWIAGIFLTTIILVSVVFAFLVTTLITNPIESLTKTIIEVEKERDFTKRVHINNKDEIGHIADAMNRLMQSIQITINQFGNNAELLNASSIDLSASTRQIDSKAQIINETLEETSSNLQETSNAMNRQAITMKEFSGRIQQMKTQASNTTEMAERGTVTMKLTKGAMEKITDSSREIANIIDDITEISQQTNSLALNAAIEASKAGTAGKGFAVVAAQVRSLAERSNHYTVKSRDLIEVSRLNVDEGSKVVQETEEMLDNMITNISEISDQVKYISDIMYEQEAIATKTSTTTERITAATKENALAMNAFYSTIMKVDTTATSLKNMARELRDRVALFKV